MNNYIGLKYKERGRDVDGLDCYGLVRLFYKQELGIDLPLFDYENDREQQQDILAQQKEGWIKVDTPSYGDVVIFRIRGYNSHIGVALDDKRFLHVRNGSNSVIDSFSTPRWKNRIEGFYKYNAASSLVTVVPHPLKTEHITVPVQVGSSISQVVESINKQFQVKEEFNKNLIVMLNGVPVHKDSWGVTFLKDGDSVTYRCLPGNSDTFRLLAVLALSLYAPYLAGYAEFAYMGTAGASIAGAATVYYGSQAAVMLAGTALINKLAPIRQPKTYDPGVSERQLMVTGGSNQAAPYSAIPVVLGKVRMTPLLGMQNYLTFENERDSNLTMLLVWGFGPLRIDESTFKFGEVPLTNYTDYVQKTVSREVEPTPAQWAEFNANVATDIDQKQLNQNALCEGDPEWGLRVVPMTTYNPGPEAVAESAFYFDFKASGVVNNQPFTCYFDAVNVQTNLNFSTTGINVTSTTLESSSRYRINGTVADINTARVTANYKPGGSIVFISGFCSAFGIPPGDWIETGTTQNNIDTINVAIHFPQGMRKISSKGNNIGEVSGTKLWFGYGFSADGLSWTYANFEATPTVNRVIREVVGHNYNNNTGEYVPIYQSKTITEPLAKRDGFTITKSFSATGTGYKFFRIRRETGSNDTDSQERWQYLHQSIIHSVSFVSNTGPVLNPPGCKLTGTAIKIAAGKQFSGQIPGFNGIVQTIAPIWTNGVWVDAPTSNPASLFRYVLTHPANPKRKAVDQIDLPAMQRFYEYCQARGFEYNSILSEQKSILDVLRDICAAGRASPNIKDGKWTVVIDEEKPQIVQHFTPHNSWNFEGVKNLPEFPHGLRVRFFNQDKDYQEDEIIVYDTGYGPESASLFESASFAGVTKKSLVIDHARWHMAQSKLRPEVYTFNADIEHIVCSRGDRVKVLHDVPAWGLGSGRIKDRVSNTKFVLSELIPLENNKTYTIRFRSSTGASTVRTVVTPLISDWYDSITLTSAIDTSLADQDDLFLFGEMNQEAQDLVILSIEPNESGAKLTAVDYGVTPTYNLFTDYPTLSANTVFESQITLPPVLQVDAFGLKKPVITTMQSDESVVERVSPGVFKYNISVSFTNAPELPKSTQKVQAQYDLSASVDGLNARTIAVDYTNGAIVLPDVVEGEQYKIRLRYLSDTGVPGMWTSYQNHVVLGKTLQPNPVSGFSAVAEKGLGKVKISWNANTEVDIKCYEVRTDTNFGNPIYNANLIHFGDNTSVFTDSPLPGQSITYYIAALDYSGLYSRQISSITHILNILPDVSNISFNFADTALTSATLNLSWTIPTLPYDLSYCEVSYNDIKKQVKANTIILPADWLGDRQFIIKLVDVIGNSSTGASVFVTKVIPNPPTNYKIQVIDNTVMLFWKTPERTTLPVHATRIKRGDNWATASLIGDQSAEFVTIDELKPGVFTYWLATVDTDGNESLPISISTQVSEPPDFEFFGEFNANWTGLKSNALVEGNSILMPVNLTETWAQHFTTRSWNSPQDQINAGYPIYAQPALSMGYYEQVFDYGTVLASSQITIDLDGEGYGSTNYSTSTSIAVSLDGITYTLYEGVTSVFVANFRYVKVRFSVSTTDNKALYRLKRLVITLDAKKKTDSMTVLANSSDTNGTVVNFTKEFIDVISIMASVNASTPLIAVRAFNDSVLIATYSVVSNVCTVSVTNHQFVTGQNVRLFFTSGLGISGIYQVTSATTNSFTVNMVIGNTSGNCLGYSQSIRVFVYDSAGTRQTAQVSLAIEGY